MVPARRTSSALSLTAVGLGSKMNANTSKSCESLHSNSSKGSASIIYRGKPKAVGIAGPTTQSRVISTSNEIRQRVLSARRLRIKTFQNQLADAQQTIAELAHENRILRTLHKRQDSALSKYESNTAELPQLLHSHAEELRVWQTKCRNLQTVNKELEQKLKQKDAAILSLSDQNKYFIQLSKEKNLEDRQRLTEKLQMLELRLQEKDNDIKLIARKMQLAAKQSKQQLQVEQRRNKEILMKLEKARLALSGYRKLEEVQLQEKFNMHLKRNRGSHNDNSKEEMDSNKCALQNTYEAEITDDIETQNSHRSTYSSNNVLQRTTRSIKNLSTKDHLTSSSSTTVMLQTTANNKSVTISKRIDQGDGDGTGDNVHDNCKTQNTFTASFVQKHLSNLSSMTQNQLDKLEDDYDEPLDDYKCYDADEPDEPNECEINALDKRDVDDNRVEEYVGCIDDSSDIKNNVKDNEDDNNESQKHENHNRGKKSRMKEEILSIRKQISDDYKEREAFLDTFCRQATNGVLRDESQKKHNTTTERNIPNIRKNKLLAALKAIDDNKSQD